MPQGKAILLSHFRTSQLTDYQDNLSGNWRGEIVQLVRPHLSFKADEKLIIYQPDQPLSFKMGIDHINTAIKTPLNGSYGSLTDATLHKNDTVKIPYLDLKADTYFTSQLQGERYYEGEKTSWRVNMAYQITHFELFETGARIRVETGTDDGPFGGPASPPRRITYIPRNFICNKPFFVFSWKDQATLPYFAAWIDGKDALKTFSKHKN